MHADTHRASRRSRSTHRSRRMLAGLLVPALGVGLAAGLGVFGGASGASNPPPLGIYIGYENVSGVSSLGSAMGQQPAYAMDYLDGTSWSTLESSASNEAAKWSTTGYSMTFSIPMLPNSGASLADGAAGDYNAYFETMAQNLVANNEASSILRVGWEFNGNWFAWGANSSNQSQFVAFWQQIVTTMRAVPGANFKFEWCPTLGGQGSENLADYYPGNAYVDDIAADVYDQSWSTYPGASSEFSDIETEPYGLDWLTSLAAQDGKEMAIGEWGLGTGPGNAGQPYSANNEQVSGGDDPTFMNDMAQWLATNHVLEASYFDDGPSTLSPSENPNSYNALLKDFGPGGVAASSAGSSSTSSAPAPTTTTTAPAPTTTTTTTAPPPTTTTTTTTTTPLPAAAGPPPGRLTLTSLDSSAGSATVGDESSLVFAVTVTPAVDETVGVYGDGGLFKLCQVTISTDTGSGTCGLGNDELGPGLYLAGAVTLSGPGFVGSFSNPVAFTIAVPS